MVDIMDLFYVSTARQSFNGTNQFAYHLQFVGLYLKDWRNIHILVFTCTFLRWLLCNMILLNDDL